MISIIIRTYNEERYLGALLEGIENQECGEPYEIILVDSGSTDRTIDIARKSPKVRILTIEKKEFTFGRSLNKGCHVANGDKLVYISGHCIPLDKHWLINLITPLANGQADISYGRQIGNETTKFSEKRVFDKYFPKTEKTNNVPFFSNNANAAMKKSIWNKYKFDEELTGLEDMHIAQRAHADGHKIRYCPNAAVYHLHHESWQQIKRRYEREAIALQQIMPQVHLTYIDALRCFMAGVLSDWASAIKKKIWLKTWHQIILYRFCQYQGSAQGSRIHRILSEKEKLRYFYPK